MQLLGTAVLLVLLLLAQLFWLSKLTGRGVLPGYSGRGLPHRNVFGMLLAVLSMQLISGFLIPFPSFTPQQYNPLIAIAGLSLYEFGIALNMWAIYRINRARRYSEKPDADPPALCVCGPFRFSRNPNYLGHLFLVAGFGIAAHSYLFLIVIPLYFWFRNLIRTEEALLEHTHGDAYRSYKKRVRRFL